MVMNTTRKPAAWLALLLSCLIAMPPVAMADDTELFTTSANPNVLLILDTSGSMDFDAGGTPVGDLDGEGNTNSRMDILWKVVYTLLNADLSIPSPSGVTLTSTLNRARRWNSSTVDTNISSTRQYQYVQVTCNSTTWAQFPDSGTVLIGSGGLSENMTYTSRSSDSASSKRFYFSSAKSFSRNYNATVTTISYTYTPSYSQNYPASHTEATGTDFSNNLTVADEEILKARLGLMTFSGTLPSTFRTTIRNQIAASDSNSPPFDTSYQSIWNSVTNYAYSDLYTPTAKALNTAQTFFNTAYNPSQVCRPNFAVLITDGEDTMGGVDGATPTPAYPPGYYHSDNPSNPFYPDGCSSFNSSHICTGSGRGQVARHNAVIQEAANLLTFNPSVKLFAVGVGISGTDPDLRVQRDVLRRAAEQLNAQGTSSDFTTVGASADNTSRGAGRAFFATDASELSTAMRNIFHQISAGVYSFTAPTVASVRMTDRNYLYKASFTPSAPPATFWQGRLEALTINNDNTFTTHWDADNVLKSTAPSARRIFAGYTDNTSWSRIDFTTSYITPAMLTVDNTDARNSIVDYVRGVGHDNNAKLGDIFHSKPVVVGPPSRFFFDQGYSTAVGGPDSFVDAKATRKRVLFVGTNDGMLHAFLSGTFDQSTGLYDSGTGEELFGFVPYNLMDDIGDFVPGDLTTHGYHVDSSPRVADVWIDSNGDGTKQSSEWRTVLISGLRKGGTSYFALDVTDPPDGTDYTNYPIVLWEYSNPSTIGQTWSEPFIGKVRMKETAVSAEKDRWVAIFGGGMSDGGPVGESLIVLDIATGTALKTFTTGIDNVIPASPTAVLDSNGYIKFVYVNDLAGSLYKFDLRTTGRRDNGFSAWTVNKIFQPPVDQPVFHRVEAGSIDESTRYLFFGTGNQESPVSDGGTGKFYAIKDTDSSTGLLTESNLANLSLSVTSLTGGTVGPSQSGWLVDFATPNFAAALTNDSNSHFAEKVLSDPVVFFNNVFFTTFTPDASNPCGGGGIARVYGLQMQNAGAGLAAIAGLGETSASKVPYHVYTGTEGGIPSSPSLSIYPSGQSSIFVGFSTGSIQEIKIESPTQMKSIKSWKEIF
jgi:type IV pilus assembly protein PilY1